uniref:Uncharacterized protein n=1 Tax=Glossina palpalis gambiensis TaxID=67801 RepID=A0A1B0BIZ4_9MUSC
MLMAHHLGKRWHRLYRSSLYRMDKVQPIKQKFADMTSIEINGFWKEVSVLYCYCIMKRYSFSVSSITILISVLLSKIFKLYKSQKSGREVWSKTLWVDLDPTVLTEGVESFLKEFRKLPKNVQKKKIK